MNYFKIDNKDKATKAEKGEKFSENLKLFGDLGFESCSLKAERCSSLSL